MNFTPYQISSQVISAFTRICTIGLRSGEPLDIYPALFADLARCDDSFPSVLILRTLDIPLSQIQDTLFDCSTAKAYNNHIQDIITQDHYTTPSDELVRYYHDQLKSILVGAWEVFFPNQDNFHVIDAPRIIAYMLHEKRPDIYPWPYMTARPTKKQVLASYLKNSLENRTKGQIIEVEAVDSPQKEEEVIQTILSMALSDITYPLSEFLRSELDITTWKKLIEQSFLKASSSDEPQKKKPDSDIDPNTIVKQVEVFVSQNNPDGETDKNSMRAVPLEELPEEIQEHIKAIIRHEQRKVTQNSGSNPFDLNADDEGDKEEKASKSSKRSKTPALDAFATNLNQLAKDGKLDPMIGRAKELERITHILCRRQKNNPVLIGEAGVGKTAVAEGLAQLLARNEVSYKLRGKVLYSVDLAQMLAGTRYRGDFEERFKALLKEAEMLGNTILLFDEIHTLMGAGSTEGSMDASNMLKPALARGTIQVIGATTLDEYRRTIEKNGALARRFQKVMIEPNTPEETLEILRQLRGRYEEFHHVRYSDEALVAMVRLTNRYIYDRYFPDKAIDVLDEVGASMHLKGKVGESDKVASLRQQLRTYRASRDKAVRESNYDTAMTLKVQEDLVQKEVDEELEKAHAKEAAIYLPVDEEAVAKTVSMMSGVPISNISQEEHAKLRQMRQTLKDIVIGQDDAIDKVVKAIQRNRLGLGSDKRPIGSFLFLGPTGVGKTYLAKKLAELLFDDEDALIRIDMSEYMESFNVSRLVGAAPGYVGYDEGGQLTEQVRRKPYSVVLFDELEKAHPDVYNILLQILDDGFITAADGTHVSFKNTVIILTSNIGTRQLKDFGAGVGFRQEVQLTQTEQEALLSKQLKKHFSPEFLNRLDETIYFASLEKEDIRKIVDVELRPIMARITEQGYNLVVTPSAKDKLADVGFDLEYGARPLRRALRLWIEDKLTDLILDGEANVGDTVRLRVSEGELLMEVDKRAPQKESQAKSDEATLGFALPSFTSSSQKGDER
ncbi:ATP-dependent Clp protease ATP-binding subunit [uncultured Porphyromonas sp.]|uniref:ATP-dependent Clp protease ATP-binding subunit n=1 Tax=uncultured Porphyromonas sp. TaxID=159274 RepID=UPI002620F637|nr:ATP-dependent Clp protease ATP-binding subunit [uncultured Porphyromonas sp.]